MTIKPNSYRDALRMILETCEKAIRTGSRDRFDWIEDMEAINHIASSALSLPDGPSGELWWRDAMRERPFRNLLVIAWTKEHGAVLADRTTNNPQFGWSCDGTVTHWMPLPSAPDATNCGEDK